MSIRTSPGRTDHVPARRTAAAFLLALCVIAAALLATATAEARRPRQGRVLASLYCDTEYEDARREADYLRGAERRMARDAARQRLEECRKRARKAYQVEDVMPRLTPR